MKTFVLPLLLFAACATSPSDLRKEAAPEEETRELDLQRAEQRRRDFQMVLVKLDQGMESYCRSLAAGSQRADDDAGKVYKLLHEMVLDIGPQVVTKGTLPREPGENYRRLQAAAADGSKPEEQKIALAALGFSGQPEMMPVILQGAQLADPSLVDKAVLGLAVLRAPTTPPGVLAAIAENPKLSSESRTQAAWALHEVQEVSQQPADIVAIWRRFLTEGKDTLPPGVLVQAVRGIGLSRDASQDTVILPFAKHPVAKIREATAVAIGRLNGQQHTEILIGMIGPQEPVPNVRLAARKALQELAGQADYGYDVAAWRKVFERGL